MAAISTKWPGLILMAICFLSLNLNAQMLGKLVLRSKVYMNPSDTSDALGAYPEGARVVIDSKTKNGWYKIILNKEYKGQSFGYVRAQNIAVAESRDGEKNKQTLNTRTVRKYFARAGAGLQ